MNDFDYEATFLDKPARSVKKQPDWSKIVYYIFNVICMAFITASVCYTAFKLDTIFTDVRVVLKAITETSGNMANVIPDISKMVLSILETSDETQDLIKKLISYIHTN